MQPLPTLLTKLAYLNPMPLAGWLVWLGLAGLLGVALFNWRKYNIEWNTRATWTLVALAVSVPFATLLLGLEFSSGSRPPLPRLTAFWWKQPDGRKLFVWMSLTYGDGFFFFEKDEWRRGPLPLAADARFRPPRAGDILKTDEASMRQAHEQCVSRLRQFERDGYRHAILAV